MLAYATIGDAGRAAGLSTRDPPRSLLRES